MLPVHLRLMAALVETIGAPIKLTVAAAAAHDTGFREKVILLAQAFHRMNVRLHRRLDTRQHARQHRHLPIRPLNEERAVDLAAHLLGELFVFGMGGSIIVAEVAKQGRAEARKEEAHRREVQEATTRHRSAAEYFSRGLSFSYRMLFAAKIVFTQASSLPISSSRAG
ncbi:unnamed protein product [Closterium sp. NIES-65]|nr:unnamed protein product [Closterium sp. NIES-65]